MGVRAGRRLRPFSLLELRRLNEPVSLLVLRERGARLLAAKGRVIAQLHFH